MPANYAWKGALELEVGGFPIQVPVKLIGRVKSRSGESFRTLDPVHKQPIHQQMLDINEKPVESGTTLRGVEIEKGKFIALTEESEELISQGVKTATLAPDTFCPLADVDLKLALQTYAVRPADEGELIARSLNTIWNGLREHQLGYISRLTTSAGGRDAIIVIYADADGLWAASLPFSEELKEVDSFDFTEDAVQAEAFLEKIVGENVAAFEHVAYTSHWRERRQQAIEAALSGKPLPAPTPAPTVDGLDLMAAIEASVSATKKPAKKAAKKGAKKVAA